MLAVADAPSTLTTAAAAAAPTVAPLPAARDLALAFGGLAALGLCAGLGSGDLATATRAAPSALLVGVGALCLTGPALLVAHQFLRLDAAPESLVGALARGFATAGQLALGLCPAMLFFAATTSLWWLLFPAFLLGMSGHAAAVTILRLIEAEPGKPPLDARMPSLVLAWAGLTGLVGLRLAWDVAWFVVGA